MKRDALVVAPRYVQAWSWWIASKLTQRNPELCLHQQVDLIDGEALVLTIGDSPTLPLEVRTRIRIALDGTGIQLVAPVLFEPLRWGEFLALANPFEAIVRIERSLGAPPARPGNLQGHALSYSVLAGVLMSQVLAAEPYSIRCTQVRTLGVDDWAATEFGNLPSLIDRIVAKATQDMARGYQPEVEPAWVIYRGAEAVGAIDDGGGFHFGKHWHDLQKIYTHSGFDLTQTTAEVTTALAV